MNKFFIVSILMAISLACPPKLECPNLQTEMACKAVDQRVAYCYWSSYDNKCSFQYANCGYYITESECVQKYDCGWYDQTCIKKNKSLQSDIYCKGYDSYESCVGQYQKNASCTWEHGKCIPISQCSEINDFMQCRKSRLQDRCQLVINDQPSGMQKQNSYLTDIFDDYQCRAQDCVYNYNGGCPNFKNGRRCFQSIDGCTQCSYITSESSCIDSNQCTWQNKKCRNILCSDLGSKSLCQNKPFCAYNEKVSVCQTRTENNLYCYSYDIGSDPKRSSNRDL